MLTLHGAAHADLVVLAASREVNASATGGVPANVSSIDLGFFIEEVSHSAFTDANTIFAMASQSSTTPTPAGPVLHGIAGAVSLMGIAEPDAAGGFASSLFDVTFIVDVDGTYALDAEVTWGNDAPPYSGVAQVELSVDGAPTTLASLLRSDAAPGTGALSTSVLLSTGVIYRLQAQAFVTADASAIGGFSGEAGWSFDLAPAAISERNWLVILTPIAFAMLAARLGRRRAGY
jgi:hypothetical protein